MKYIFSNASGTYDYCPFPNVQFVIFKKGDSFWLNSYEFDNIEDWLSKVNLTLCALGITDVQCMSFPPDEKDGEKHRLAFYFARQVEQLQFQLLVEEDTEGSFSRLIDSPTASTSRNKEENIKSFLFKNEIKGSIKRFDDKTFRVETEWLYDDIAIAMHLAKGNFDKPSVPRPSSSVSQQIAVLLRTPK